MKITGDFCETHYNRLSKSMYQILYVILTIAN